MFYNSRNYNFSFEELLTVVNYLPFGPCLVPRPIIARGRCISGHVVRADLSSRIRDQNALTEKAWEDAAQGLGNIWSHHSDALLWLVLFQS